MDANQLHYVGCHKGVFVLPDAIVKTLSELVRNGFVYLREDDEVLTISTSRIVEGYRRALNGRFRAQMFRNARKLAIVNLRDSLRVMAVN